MTIRVVLADDQSLVRAGFRVLVNSAPDLEVVGEAANGQEVVALTRDARPDVVLMDIRMPDMDGLVATRQITADESLAAVRVLVLTTFEIDEYVFAALRAGASGFLGKGVEAEDLHEAIRVVARGDARADHPVPQPHHRDRRPGGGTAERADRPGTRCDDHGRGGADQ